MAAASPSRRTFLAAVSGAALALGAPSVGHAAAGDEFDTLRLRWRDLILGTGYDPAAQPFAGALAALGATAAGYHAAMAPAAGSLWPDLPLAANSAHITSSWARLNAMAQAWAQPATGHTGDAELVAAVAKGMDHLYDQVYNERTSPYGNWWDWQIGSPRLSLDTAVLAHDALTAGQTARCVRAVDHFVPDSAVASYSGTSTGANRTDLCRVLAVRGLLGRTAAKLALARDALSPVFPYVTSGDGLYADGSFVQHTYVAYTGTYGEVQLDGLARLFALLAGSSWQVTDPARGHVFDAVEHAYAPFLHDGLVMDVVSGRAVSRGLAAGDPGGVPADDHLRGHAIMAHIVMLADSAGAARRDRWYGLVKGWVARDTYRPALTDPGLGVADLARLATAARSRVPARPEPVGHRLFAAMDRAVHRRPGWTAALSMCSRRIAYYETGNGENPCGWHTGDGMLTWWAGERGGGQYSDGFWPTVDPYRLPGTTVSRKRLADGAGGEWGAARPDTDWAGGTTDGEFAVTGQHLEGLDSTLTARKSWFWLADEVVCLGAGITCRDGTGMETVVDNRDLGAHGTPVLTVDGVRQPGAQGWTATFRHARWAHLDGHGGYLFPGGTRLSALREERTGTWRRINPGGSTEPVTRRYLTLWTPHGTDPSGAAYAYVLMPGASRDATAARAADRGHLRLLANSGRRQAVEVPALGVTAANFWTAGTAARLTVTAPAGVLLRRTGATARIHLAAPDRTGTPVRLRWAHPVRRVLSAGPGVEVVRTAPALEIAVDPGTACATRTVVVRTG